MRLFLEIGIMRYNLSKREFILIIIVLLLTLCLYSLSDLRKSLFLNYYYNIQPNQDEINNISKLWYNVSDYNNLNIYEFANIFNFIYEYSEYKDCKYWNYIWYEFLKNKNLIVDYKLMGENLLLPNHIMVIAYNNSHYYIADQTSLIEFFVTN